MHKVFLSLGAILAATGVALGAFGAHALQKLLEESGRLDTYETAVRYQFYHALGLLAIGLLVYRQESILLTYAGWTMFGGVLLFSGSLYILCLTGFTKLGMLAPVGGLLLIIGWVLMTAGVLRNL